MRSTQVFTGAAQTWFVVNIPATVAGVAETMSARSRFGPLFEPLPVPSFLMSQKTPLARKPLGATREPGISLNDFFMLLRMEICGSRAKFSNFYRINFQANHFDVNISVRILRMLGDV